MGKTMERRLPGESDSSSDPVDVEHWIDVYAELHRLVREVVERAGNDSAAIPERESLNERLRWMRRRLDFWNERQAQLKRARRREDTAS
jgi:hypothetical protein